MFIIQVSVDAKMYQNNQLVRGKGFEQKIMR